MNKEAVDLILKQNPQLKGQRQAFESLEAGVYCWHQSWGVGCIKGYDEVNHRILIDFESQEDTRSMDPVFCVQKVTIIPEDHMLVEARKNPEKIKQMQKEQPCELVVEILRKMPNQSASALELEHILTQVLSAHLNPAQFKRWWSNLQKLMVKDPRIATPRRKTDAYVLREEPILPEQEILEEFYLTKRPLEKITLGAKLYQLADSIDVIRNDLPQVLDELTRAIQQAKLLTQAQRLEGCWVRNNLARYLHESVEELEPTSQSIIRETENLPELVAQLPHVYYARFLDLLTRTYMDDTEWQHIVLSLLKYGNARLTSECINFLLDRDCESLLKKTLDKWLHEQSLKSSILIWIIKHRSLPRYESLLSDIIGVRLLSCIFQAIDSDALNVAPGRRIPLVEAVNDDQQLIGDLLKNADVALAQDLARNLLLNQGFDTLKKRSLMARFIRVFPELQRLTENKETVQEERLLVSKESLELMKQEYLTLINEKIPANKAAIAAARELGDLSENSEYKMARQDQTVLMARKSMLEKELNRAQIINFDEVSTDSVNIGTEVSLKDAKGKLVVYTILGAWDGDPKKNILSYKTPLASEMLGKKVGDSVTLPTGQTLSIEAIKRWKA